MEKVYKNLKICGVFKKRKECERKEWWRVDGEIE